MVILATPVKKNGFEQAADFLLLVAPALVRRIRGDYNVIAFKRKHEGNQSGRQENHKVGYYWEYEEERAEITVKIKLLNSKDKKKPKTSDHDSKIAPLEQTLEEHKQIIASMSSKGDMPLPPKVSFGKDPLKPPTGFTKCE